MSGRRRGRGANPPEGLEQYPNPLRFALCFGQRLDRELRAAKSLEPGRRGIVRPIPFALRDAENVAVLGPRFLQESGELLRVLEVRGGGIGFAAVTPVRVALPLFMANS